MKTKYSNSDYLKSNLPSTRFDQAKDLLKNDYNFFLKIGMVFLVLCLPQALLFLFKQINILDIFSSYNNGLISYKEAQSLTYSIYLIYDGIQFLTIFIIFLGFCGVFRVLRVTFWNEGLFFKDDFLKGIKNNIKRTIVYSLFFSMILFLKDQIYYIMCVNNFSGANIIDGIGSVLIIVLLIPFFFMMMELDNYYVYTIGDSFVNTVKLLIRKFFKFLLLALPLLIILFKDLLNPIIIFVVLLIIIILILPIIVVFIHGSTLNTFDELINIHHLEIHKKGLKEPDIISERTDKNE